MSNSGASTDEICEEPEEVIPQEENEEENGVLRMPATGDHAKEIFERLESVSKIILTGEAGTGKTWMARKICELVEENCDEPIWISLEQEHDEISLYDTIARHFSLPTSTDAREDTGKNEKKEELKEKHKAAQREMKEKHKAAQREMEKKLKAAEGFVLIVLDGEVGRTMTDENEKSAMNILGLEVSGESNKDKVKVIKDKLKVLITRRDKESSEKKTRRDKDGDFPEGTQKVVVEPLSGNQAIKLLTDNVDNKFWVSKGYKKLYEAIQAWSKVLPAEILMLVGALNLIAEDKSASWDLERALEAAAKDLHKVPEGTAGNELRQILRYTYDKEPGANCLIDCFWHSWHFLGKHGGVHYNELITFWIMEGHLNPSDPIDKSYEDGHRVLMKLIRCHLLKMQEDNVVVLEGATLDMDRYCRRGYSTGTADPGLANVLKEDHHWKVLEGIAPADGMMKTLCSDDKEKMISSLLVDGGRLSRELPETFFGDKPNLRLLAIFNPRLKLSKEVPISKMKELLVLMLRGSYLLKDINNMSTLKKLIVLEISDSTQLEEIPDIFGEVSKLRSLDLSGAGMKSLPPTFTELTGLRRLILKKCSSLKQLPKLSKFSELEIIDLSGSKNLEKIQEKSFKSLGKLQVIDFSHTKIEKLPIVKSLEHIKILLLKGCDKLSGMRSLKEVSSIRILDLSGAKEIKEIMFDSLEGAENLTELDLSETQIQFLPSEVWNLQKLRLKKCSLLKKLPELKGESRLEELDLTECTSLDELPDLTALKDLKVLVLNNCNNLKSLPGLESLSKLEKLDLSDCTSLDNLPDLTALKDLKILVLNKCKNLKSLPGLESLSKLEKLDVGGTNLLSKEMEKSLAQRTGLEILK